MQPDPPQLQLDSPQKYFYSSETIADKLSLKLSNKFISLFPTYNNTYVLVTAPLHRSKQKQNRENQIIHFEVQHLDAKGKILWKEEMGQYITSSKDCFGQLNNKEIVGLNLGKECVEIIDVENLRIKRINHVFDHMKDQKYMRYQVETFSGTGYFCVIQEDKQQKQTLLTYYKYEGFDKKCELVVEKQVKQQPPFYKLDNHSQIGTQITLKQNKQLSFSIFDLRKSRKGRLQTISITYPTLRNKILSGLRPVWYMGKHKYLVYSEDRQQFLEEEGSQEISLYVLDYGKGQENAVLKMTKFRQKEEQQYYKFTARKLVNFYSQSGLYVLTFTPQKISSIFSKFGLSYIKQKVILIDKKAKKILNIDQFVKEDMYNSLTFKIAAQKIYYMTQIRSHPKDKGTHVQVKTYKYCVLKEFYLQCLLWFYEDFDDDLLYDAMQILGAVQ